MNMDATQIRMIIITHYSQFSIFIRNSDLWNPVKFIILLDVYVHRLFAMRVLVSSPGHSQILSRSRFFSTAVIKSGSGLGTRLEESHYMI